MDENRTSTLAERLECVERELRRRLDEYPKLVTRKKLRPAEAQWEERVMRDIVEDYAEAVERNPQGAGLLL